MKIRTKNGISLIVLLITILVMAILLTTVVLSIRNQNITEASYETVIKEKIESYRIDIEDYVSKQELEQGMQYNKKLLSADTEKIIYDGNIQEGNIFSILHSMTEEDSKIFQIENGRLIYLPDLTSDIFSKEEFEFSCRSGLISYISDNLIGYYEPTNNVGGSFNEDVIAWKDLSLNDNNGVITKSDKTPFINDAFVTNGSNISVSFPINIPKNTSFTVEVVYKNLDNTTPLFTLSNGIILNSIGQKDNIYETFYIYDSVSDSIKIYNISGTLQTTMYSVGLKDQNITSIKIPTTSNKEYYCIRVYNKNMLDTNQRNLNIDAKRFEDIN